MRKLLGTALVVAGTVIPGVAAAQMGHDMGAPEHELGVDLTFFYSKISSLGLVPSTNAITAGMPVDVRVGFVSHGSLSFEPRFAFAYTKPKGIKAFYTISPDLNVLWRLGQGHGNHNMMGPYLTAGAGINLTGAGGTSASQISINGGIGTRSAYGPGAFRVEAFGRYNLKNNSKGIPSSLDIGVRAGLSLWH